MKYLYKLLATFDYESLLALGQSLAPSTKYNLTIASLFISVALPALDRVFGLDGYAFALLLMVFTAELSSGILAAHIRKETLSSMKLSRFSFKVFYYLVLISMPYVLAQSFLAHNKTFASTMFDWLHLFLLSQIVLENIVSILENVAVIDGKDKTHWIAKIQAKVNTLFGS